MLRPLYLHKTRRFRTHHDEVREFAEDRRWRRNQKRMQDNKLYRAGYYRSDKLP